MPKQPQAFTITSSKGTLRELRTHVHIGPAFDHLHEQPPSLRTFSAIWDTGATGSLISRKVVEECSLKPTGMAVSRGVHDEKECNTYLVSIGLPQGVGFDKLPVMEADGLQGTDVLIGMDVITQGDFAVTNKDSKTVFSFRTPSLDHIDFVKDTNRARQQQGEAQSRHKDTGRNDPCPCGSGQKYKKCCLQKDQAKAQQLRTP